MDDTIQLKDIDMPELQYKLGHYAFVVQEIGKETTDEQIRLLKSLSKELGDTADFLKRLR